MKTPCALTLLLCVVVLACMFGPKIHESFRNMHYLDYHDYLDCQYNGVNCPQGHPYHVPQIQQTHLRPSLKTRAYWWFPSWISNWLYQQQNPYAPGFRQPSPRPSARHYSHDSPIRIGMIHSTSTEDNQIYALYEYHDFTRNRSGYLYKDLKLNQESSYAFHPLKAPLNQQKIFDGDTVDIFGQDFTVRLDKQHGYGFGTRYNPYTPAYEYALLRPVNPIPSDDLQNNQDRYFVLYEKEIDPSRDEYNYYIIDQYGDQIRLNEEKKLDDRTEVTIPGKEKYGTYRVEKIDIAY